ncbi:LytR/AlgR family response regulator transcription factor [Psychroserpens sp.]|uniref:LytR/AlgR family response regulator transcription factor n=1 Tax=Psychroserpens sp. TaxID=2020870 RepID=UPI00385A09A5
MKSLKIYIVEDEPIIVSTIETSLKKHGFSVLGDSDDALTALKDIELLHPDLVLVDIQLSGTKDGVDLAILLDEMKQPYLFLSSQTDPDTIKRVKQTNPLGYIVKPFTETGLQTNIELAWHNYQTQHSDILEFKSEGRLHRVNQNQVLYLKAFDNYCYIQTTTKTYLVPHTLKHTSEKLNQNLFIKCHRSYMVNINHIDSIGSNKLLLKTESIPISASQKSIVMSKLKGR